MKKLYLGALALCMMASCQNEDAAVLDTQHVSKMEITASLDNSVGSRTALLDDGNGGYKVIWTEGDLLSVFYGSSDAHNQFELNTGAGETTATFKSVGSFVFSSDTENGDNSFANVGYYPYSASTTVSKNNDTYVINTEIPVNQTYAESSFAQNASPMVAVSNGLDFAFKNVASVLRVPLKGEKQITKATLTAPSKIVGAATVTLTETDGNWIPSVNVEDGSAMVVLNCTTPVQLNPSTATNFFFVLAPGTYEAGMVVKFYASDGTYYSYTTQNEQTFKRSEVKFLEEKTYGATGTGHSNGTVGVSEANDELANGVENVEVIITNNDTNPTLELPATTSENPTNINFTSLPVDELVTIQASTESQGDEAKNVNLTVPQNANGYDFNIDLPNSTVTLNANEGQQATYDEVTAATAENTLIIGEGVTVKKLKIKKGHVRVHGKVEDVSREGNANGDVTYIIYEVGAEIPSQLSEGMKAMSAAEWDLRKEIAAGETEVTLDANIDLTSSLEVSSDLVVNLNGKEVKCASSDVFVVTAGTLTINGDGLVWGSEDNSSSSCAVWAKGTGKAIINGGTYKVGDDTSNGKTGNWRNDCIYAKEQASIEVNGGEFMYTGENPAGHTFLLNLKDSDGATLVVKGGKFHKFNPAASNGENPIANFVAAGYSSVAEGECFLVKEGIYNETALKAAMVDDAEVILKSDIELTDYLEIRDVNVVINLNSHTISHSVNSTAKYKDVFEVYGTAELTIEGEGSVVAEDGYSVYATGDSKVNLNGGYYFSPVSVVDARKNAIVTINGGEFKVDGTNNSEGDFGQKYTLNLRDKTGNYAGELAAIIVKGGKFYKYNPAESPSENPVANFVAEGYSSVVDGDYYEVKEGIFNETALKAAIVNGAEIELSANITLEKAITIPIGIAATINLNGFDVTAPNTDAFEVAGTLTIKDTKNEGVVSAGTENPAASVCAVWANGGTVTIDGGHYKVYSDASGKRNDCIYAGYNADNNDTAGNITINGGKFEYVWPKTKNSGLDYNGDMFLLNCADKDLYQTHITVNGGEFKNNAPSYEDTTPKGRIDNEVKLGEGKGVYSEGKIITEAHSSTTDIWYVVK